MATTDPKLIERLQAIDLAMNRERMMLRDLSWYMYEGMPATAAYLKLAFSLHGLLPRVEAAINEAAQKERAGIWARMCSIEPDEELAGCPASWGDFLQILEGELAAASERGTAMDALIADSADMIDVHKESQHG